MRFSRCDTAPTLGDLARTPPSTLCVEYNSVECATYSVVLHKTVGSLQGPSKALTVSTPTRLSVQSTKSLGGPSIESVAAVKSSLRRRLCSGSSIKCSRP